jgi:hypothetical protein
MPTVINGSLIEVLELGTGVVMAISQGEGEMEVGTDVEEGQTRPPVNRC